MESLANTGLSSREVIIQLIKEDLRSSKLVLGLSELGLDAGKYHLNISSLVFNLMGINEQNEKLLDIYMEFMDRTMSIPDIEQEGILQRMAEELYALLLSAKNESNNG